MRFVRVSYAVCLAGLLLLMAAHATGVRAQEPVVQPADVATPTPKAALPTPTGLPPVFVLPTATPVANPPVLPQLLLSSPTPQPDVPQQQPMPVPSEALPGDVAGAASTPAVGRTDSVVTSPTGMNVTRGYTVRAGDTLLSVALETGLDIENAPCAVSPEFRIDQPLVIGDTLLPPPANVVCHLTVAGDTLASIAAQYGASVEEIYQLPWNRLALQPLATVQLEAGRPIRVPLPLPGANATTEGAGTADANTAGNATPVATFEATATTFLPLMLTMPINTSPLTVLGTTAARRAAAQPLVGPVPADWPYGSGHFAWPVYGWLSQGYRYDHRALDIAAVVGTPVTAADRGVVLRAGWNDQGYGNFVIIDHKIDYLTLYAHLDRILVKEGDVVGQGQVLGTVGSTGNSTGPHLHFEIRDFGRLINPLELLTLN